MNTERKIPTRAASFKFKNEYDVLVHFEVRYSEGSIFIEYPTPMNTILTRMEAAILVDLIDWVMNPKTSSPIRHPRYEREYLTHLKSKGLTNVAIAEKIGISESTVRRMLKK